MVSGCRVNLETQQDSSDAHTHSVCRAGWLRLPGLSHPAISCREDPQRKRASWEKAWVQDHHYPQFDGNETAPGSSQGTNQEVRSAPTNPAHQALESTHCRMVTILLLSECKALVYTDGYVSVPSPLAMGQTTPSQQIRDVESNDLLAS